jgi:hypothetical protein
MHGSERPSPPPAGPPGVLRVGPGSSPDDLERAARLLERAADPFTSGSDSEAGPEFEARYESDCAVDYCQGDGTIWEGDHIRAVGNGEYAHSDCIEHEDCASG